MADAKVGIDNKVDQEKQKAMEQTPMQKAAADVPTPKEIGENTLKHIANENGLAQTGVNQGDGLNQGQSIGGTAAQVAGGVMKVVAAIAR